MWQIAIGKTLDFLLIKIFFKKNPKKKTKKIQKKKQKTKKELNKTKPKRGVGCI